MLVSPRKSALLAYIEPFHLGLRRQPDAKEMKRVEALISDLAGENPASDPRDSFRRIGGMWKCIFTNSRFVLGLDRLRVMRLSAAYQDVFIHADGASGHYFNIAEMSC